MYIQLRVPTYNHNYFVLHCCFVFSASARNHVTARASSWLVNAARISTKVQIFQLAWFTLFARMARQTAQTLNLCRVIRAASFSRIAPQDCQSRLCIDLTCKSFSRNASFTSGVNAPWHSNQPTAWVWGRENLFYQPITDGQISGNLFGYSHYFCSSVWWCSFMSLRCSFCV